MFRGSPLLRQTGPMLRFGSLPQSLCANKDRWSRSSTDMSQPEFGMDKWWHHAVGYQIWPASFKDSNKDGVGDLGGIIEKLDYLQDVGVDLIWLSPVYDSPQVDMGYDVADYENIYAAYGSLGDMDDLIQQCQARGIKLVMDLVVNHTSDQHRWFIESCRSRTGPYADWYIWRDAQYDSEGKRRPPNNWRTGSRRGGKSCWTYVAQRDQYYFNFGGPYQPNLNWLHTETRDAIYESAVRFWLRRGIDGFRLDVCGFYWKDPAFPDAPVVYPGDDLQPLDGKYCHNGAPVHEWLRELRAKVVDEFGDGIVMIGELPGTGAEEYLRYIGPQSRELDMALDTDIFITGNNWTDAVHELRRPALPLLKDAVAKTQSMLDAHAWPTVFLENHDFARSVCRFGPGASPMWAAGAKMLALMATTLSGTLFLYQGEEIGMTNVPDTWARSDFRDQVDLEKLDDAVASSSGGCGGDGGQDPHDAVKALALWGRDNGRTPVQWSAEAHAGFSAVSPWIPVIPNYATINVAAQLSQPDSVLAWWKRLVCLRKSWANVLLRGRFRLLARDDGSIFAYTKRDPHTGEEVLVVLNFSDDEVRMDVAAYVPHQRAELQLSTYETARDVPAADMDTLRPWEGRLYLLLADNSLAS